MRGGTSREDMGVVAEGSEQAREVGCGKQPYIILIENERTKVARGIIKFDVNKFRPWVSARRPVVTKPVRKLEWGERPGSNSRNYSTPWESQRKHVGSAVFGKMTRKRPECSDSGMVRS